MSNKDFRPIVRELRDQGWEVEKLSSGHWRAKPPDKSKPLVHFAESNEPRALKNTIAELRSSGFQWPPSAAGGAAAPSPTAAAIDRSEILSPERSIDDLMAELEEAKGYFELATTALRDAERIADEARTRVADAVTEKMRAREILNAARDRLHAEIDKTYAAA